MSVCLGCVLALGSFGFVSGLGRAVQLVAGFRRDRAIARALDESAPTTVRADGAATEPTTSAFDAALSALR